MAGGCAGQTPSQAGGAGDRPAALSLAQPHARNGARESTADQLRNWRADMLPRRRRKRAYGLTHLWKERLAEEADHLRLQAEVLPPDAARDALIRKARQAETGSHMSEWVRSPGLQPPTK
jgi:hypothetical protein